MTKANTGSYKFLSLMTLGLLLTIGATLDNSQFVTDASSGPNANFSNPAETWNDLLDEFSAHVEEFNDSQIELLVRVAELWLTQYDDNVFEEIYSSLRSDSSRVVLLNGLFDVMYDTNSENVLKAAQWLNSHDRELLTNILSRWANSDPLLALEVANAIEDDSDSLHLKRAVIESWKQTNPINLLENLERVPDDLRDWGQVEALRNMTKTAPPTVPEWLEQFELDERAFDEILDSLLSNWGEQDPRAALAWVYSLFDTSTRDEFSRSILQPIIQSDPTSALAIALEQPARR